MIQKIKKPISILLSLLMVLSVFVVVPVTASAAATYTKDSAGIDDGITLVNPGDTIYTSDTSGSLLFYSDITCDYSNDGTNLGVIPCGNLWSDVDSFSINDNYMYICSSYGEPSTFIPDDGKVLKVSYRSDIDLWIIAAVDPSAIPQTPVFYTKDSEGIADGIILDSATDMICTVNTSRILVFDCDVQCDYNNEGTSVFDIRKGDTWYDTSSFLINDNNDFLFINSGTSSKLTSGSGTPFKVSYDSSENKWHIIDGSEPVPLPDDLFVKVTSEDQVTEDNIGACTFSDAKEWVYDHWDEITNGVDDGYIDFNFVYVDSNDALGFKNNFGFYLNDISTKEMFKANCNSSYVTEIDSIKESYSSDILYLCKVRDPEPATYTVTWKNGDTVLETDTDVAEGTTPTYDGTTPTKNPDGKYVYTFSGWSPEVTAVTGDVTYTAQFDKMIYSIYINEGDVIDAGETIRFMALKQGNNWRAFELHIYFDGELVKEVFSEDGSTTEPDRYYTTTQKCIVDSYNVEGPYHPIYLKSLHTVTWKNGDDVLETDNDVAFGTTPTYDGATPYKADGADCIYTFSGWTPEVSAVTGDATYTATFTESEKPETIKDCNNKYGDFRLYSNVPIVSFSNVDDLLTGAIIPITYGDSNTMIPVQDAKGYSYKFYDQTGTEIPAQIASSSSAPGSNYELSDDVTVYTNVINFTRPAGCTAIYIVATEPAVDLFPQHSITLGGNIGVNFYIDSAAADFANASTAVVKFTWDGGGEDRTKEVDLTKLTPNGDGYYKATVDVVAAQMAHKIHAEVYLNGEKLEQTDDYSVQDYAETVFANPEEYDSEKPEQLKALAQALLNYGAMAQTVFDSSLKEHPALANKTVGNNGYADVTADMIAAAINGEASDLNEVATQLGAKYYTNSLIYLSKNTLRIYFTPTSYPGEIPNAGAYDGNLSGYYYYVDHEDIPAAELDNQQTFNVNGTEFTFSALDYAKAVVESTKMEPDQQNLAKALYLYNMTANDYFDAAPAPVENVVDLSTLTAAYEAQDGDVLINALSGDYQITIAAGATVTLRDATITCLTTDAAFAGITPLGDATILLEGTNTVKGGHRRMPGIYIPANKTLTIDGTGSLVAYSGGDFSATSFSDSPASCGIGGKRNVSSGGAVAGGNLVINGGTITAYGGNGCAGIGSCASNGVISTKMFGDITINGGTVTASGLDKAAGIGSGKGTPCGNITITGGTVTATGDGQAAGIGSGYLGDCGDITIAGTVTSVTATKGSNATNSIGAGYSGTCGTVTIEDGANVIQN